MEIDYLERILDRGPWIVGNQFTLADIAMHYWKTDLRTSDVSGYAGSAENRHSRSSVRRSLSNLIVRSRYRNMVS